MAYYHNFYVGNSYGLDNPESPVKYRPSEGSLSLSLDPRTANQLQEVSNKLNLGLKNVEVQALGGQLGGDLNKIPKQHLEEINRMSKLLKVNLSMHGPLVEASGVNGQQRRWEESSRMQAERQISEALTRGHDLNPEGNIVVTFHSTAVLPEMFEREKVEVEGGEKKEKVTSFFVVEERGGGFGEIRETERYFPQEKEKKPYVFEPKKELEKLNSENWIKELDNFAYHVRIANSYIERGENDTIKDFAAKVHSGQLSKEDLKKYPEYQEILGYIEMSKSAGIMLRNSYDQMKELYDKAYKSSKDLGNSEYLQKLDNFGDEVRKNFNKIKQNDVEALNEIVQKGIDVLGEIKEVKTLKPLNEFAIEKSADTFSGAAFDSYKKFKNTAPIISIENPPAGGGISRAEDLKNLIVKSREKFSEKLQKDGYSGDEAKKIAEKMIGATWDVGHINMIRKMGYDEADVVKESKTIAPYLKHIHLSDNFGMEHSELPMGMGNVPLKKMMEALGKTDEVKKVIEAGDWWSQFRTPPIVETLQAFGSQVYSGGPYWNQSAYRGGNYFSGYGDMLPDQHFQMYGGGFSSLPRELGGQIAQKGSRFSGTPNA